MFDFPHIDFSELCCFPELDAVGIGKPDDLVKPAIIAFLKDGIQQHVINCNLSKKACGELLETFEEKGFEIILDKDVQPDVTTLPQFFGDSSEDAEGDEEHQRALNYVSWIFDKAEFEQKGNEDEDALSKDRNIYPLNLLKDVFGENVNCTSHTAELCSVVQKQLEKRLWGPLTRKKLKLLQSIYQKGLTKDDVIRFLGLPNSEVVAWAVDRFIWMVRREVFAKIIARGRWFKDYLEYASYLESVEGATIEDIKNSFLRESQLTWLNDQNETKNMNWDDIRHYGCIQSVLDVEALPTRLILYTEEFNWCEWPKGLMLGKIPNWDGFNREEKIEEAYFSTNPDFGHYLLVVMHLANNEDRQALFEFSEGLIESLFVDERILKNLHRKIVGMMRKDNRPEVLKILYDAQRQYCDCCIKATTDPRDKEYYQMFRDLVLKQMGVFFETEKENVLDMTVEELDLSMRSCNCLKSANINTVRDLVAMSQDDMLKVRHLGTKCIEEIASKMEAIGVSFREEE